MGASAKEIFAAIFLLQRMEYELLLQDVCYYILKPKIRCKIRCNITGAISLFLNITGAIAPVAPVLNKYATATYFKYTQYPFIRNGDQR